ncbi:MAG: hypothetical protein ACKVP3_01555 [Hyphomicrobiaceae bacterium]
MSGLDWFALQLQRAQPPHVIRALSAALLGMALALVSVCLPKLSVSEETGTAFVDKIAAAYGGAELLPRLATMRQTGRTMSAMRGNVEGDMVRQFVYPDKLRIEIDYVGDVRETRILDGMSGWMDGEPVTGPMLMAMRLQAARLALPLLLISHRNEVIDHGHRRLTDGREIHLLELPLGEHSAISVEVDPESAMILRSHSLVALGGAIMEFMTVYSEFNSLDGVLVATREEQYAMGNYVGWTSISRIDFPESIAASSFRP